MLEVTPSAIKQIAEYFKGKDIKPIRIFLNEGGWGGPNLAMALDEPTETDDKFKFQEFEFIINKSFLEKAKPVKVDFLENGFKLDSNIKLNSGCSSCDTSGTTCST